jgi:transposase InsO family protein
MGCHAGNVGNAGNANRRERLLSAVRVNWRAGPARCGSKGSANVTNIECISRPWDRVETLRMLIWKLVLASHWDVLAAVDFTTIEVWTKNGLVTIYLLFVLELATRRVHFAGSTTGPDEAWMKQVARNLTVAEEGFLHGKRYVLMDRDAQFCEAFRKSLHDAGIESVRLPPRSPNCNAHLERFMRSLKEECVDRLIFSVNRLYIRLFASSWSTITRNATTKAWAIA